MLEPALAVIAMFAGDFAPAGWALCQGQLLAINQNQALFSLVGTTYGGNGVTTFGLPDLRGRTPYGVGQGPGLANVSLGQVTGTESITLLATNLPAHTHAATLSVATKSSAATSDEASGAILAGAASNRFVAPGSSNGSLGGVTATVQPAGNNVPVSIRQPYLVISFIIALQGIFPSRN